jgi:hypothetical protein
VCVLLVDDPLYMSEIYFDILKMSVLFVNDTLYRLIYVIENISLVGMQGMIIDLSCGNRNYTIYAYSHLENLTVYPFQEDDDTSMDVLLLLHKIHVGCNLPTKELRIKLGRQGTFVQLKHLEALQKWRRRCMDFMI